MKVRFFLLLLVILMIASAACGQADDITRMGKVSPLFYLADAFSVPVTGSDGSQMDVQVSDIAVEKERILIRFYILDLPESWKDKITNDSRIYGSYLPVAELLLNDGTILTPASESRYSLLEYNSRLILGGLAVFYTDLIPQVFYLNFNQIPFDTEPLQEGFTKAIRLTSIEEHDYGSPHSFSVSGDELTFTLSSSAQTNSLTMLQPAVHMERSDEALSKFGWITFTNTLSGKRYAAERGTLYGFNLADDTRYTQGHAYVFAPVSEETVLEVSMDYAYVIRSFDNPAASVIDLRTGAPVTLLSDDEFRITLLSLSNYSENGFLRLFIEGEDIEISDISFRFPGLNGTVSPSVSCGIDPENGKFACDIDFGDNSIPRNALSVEIDAVEYRKEGPWTFFWVPAVMEESEAIIGEDSLPIFQNTVYGNQGKTTDYPETIRYYIDLFQALGEELRTGAGWIYEAYDLDYKFSQSGPQNLIPVDTYSQYLEQYITENWYHVDNDSYIYEILTVIRDRETQEILSAQLRQNGKTTDLLHALRSNNTGSVKSEFICFEDFRDLADSSAEFISSYPCGTDNTDICIEFYQSLTGIPGARGNQQIVFRIERESSYLIEETIDYDNGALILTRSTLSLGKTDELPENIQDLLDTLQ